MPEEPIESVELTPGEVSFNGDGQATILKPEANTFLNETFSQYGVAFVANELALLHNSNCKGATCNGSC